MNKEAMSPQLDAMLRAAKAGGAIIREYFGQALEMEQKSSVADFRTKADVDSEKVILDILTSEFPAYNMKAEEYGEIDRGSEFTFVIDPLDGTNNFSLGIPNFTVSIGLMRGDESVVGVIYAPMLDHAYFAEKGKGAFHESKRLTVSPETDIKKATLANCNGYQTYVENEIGITRSLYSQDVKRVTINWCLTFDFCLLASGRTEGMLVDGLELHDFAAGKLIVREAGAIVTNLDGSPAMDDLSPSFLIANNQETLRYLVEAASKTSAV